MIISMPRGDIRPVSFTISGDAQEGVDFDNIYFTVKKDYLSKAVIFQKTLASGQIEKLESGAYQFFIEPEDTNKLDYRTYVFDIEVVSESAHIKQTFLGKLTITQEVTFPENEV